MNIYIYKSHEFGCFQVEQTLICNFAAKHLLSVQIDESAARAEVHDICFATVVDNFILFS